MRLAVHMDLVQEVDRLDAATPLRLPGVLETFILRFRCTPPPLFPLLLHFLHSCDALRLVVPLLPATLARSAAAGHWAVLPCSSG